MLNHNAVAVVFDSSKKCRNRFAVDQYLIRDPRVGRSASANPGLDVVTALRFSDRRLLVELIGGICRTLLSKHAFFFEAVSPGSDRSNCPAKRRVCFSNSTRIEGWLGSRPLAHVRRANVPSCRRTTNDSMGHRRGGYRILVLQPSQPNDQV